MILIIAIVLVFFLSLIPYHLYQSAQLYYFLFPFHQVQPDFLSQDWLVTQTVNPHPVFTFVIASLKSLGNLPLALFAVYTLQLLLLILGIFKLSSLFSKDIRAPLLVFSFLLFYFSDGLGQSTLYSSIVQPTDLAVPFYLFSLVALFREKILAAWILLGVSGLFHVHFGIDGALVLLGYWLLRGRHWDLKQMGLGLALFLLLFSPNLVSIVKNFSSWESIHSREILMFLFNFRGPHHYRPSVFELSHSVRVLFPLFFLLQSRGLFHDEKMLDRTRLYAAIVLGFLALAAVTTEFLSFPFVAQFFFFRLSPFLLLLGLILLSQNLIQELDKKDGLATLLSGITLAVLFLEKDSRLFIPLSLFLLAAWMLRTKIRWKELALIQKSLLTMALVSFPTLLYLGRQRVGELVLDAFLALALICFLKMKPERLISRILLAFLIMGVPALCIQGVFPERISFHPIRIAPPNPLAKSDPAMAQTLEWMRTQTAQDALFLTPPYQAGIRFFAERAIVVDFHAHPYGTQEVKEWKERLETVTQTSGLEKWDPQRGDTVSQREFLKRAYLRLTPDKVERIAHRYGASYFLTESTYPDKESLVKRGHHLVFQNSSYLVFRLTP